VRIALHQLNPVVGDIDGNAARIEAAIIASRAAGAQLIVFPELAICGYPPEDLLLKEHFTEKCRAALQQIATAASGPVVLVGFPESEAGNTHNAAAVLADRRVQAVYRKMLLPNYGVFDEHRYFVAGSRPAVIEVDGIRIGLTICEDDWIDRGPAADCAAAGARLIVNLSASPYQAGKPTQREQMFIRRAREYDVAYGFCAQVGGQDELVFDGSSAVIGADGRLLARAEVFAEGLVLADLDDDVLGAGAPQPLAASSDSAELLGTFMTTRSQITDAAASGVEHRPAADEEIYAALVCGTRDYAEKNGFGHAVLGVSGGIDSALVLAIAVDALGPERVTSVVMPSPYSAEATQSDARALASGLGTGLIEFSITDVLAQYRALLKPALSGHPPGLTDENLQSRIRGNLLMALSNTFGWLVLTTGNKSEMSVGYSTLYGDSAGGFAVIKDCPKTLVYRLMKLRAARHGGDQIPETIISRPPSAELRPDQKDSDSLPDYAILDPILEGYIERDLGRDALIAQGLPADAVDQAIRLVDLAEYKRRQNPPGIKITSKAFGRDRRMPITNRFGG